MIIDMKLNKAGVIARINQPMDGCDICAHEVFHGQNHDKIEDVIGSILNRLSKKVDLCNVISINLSTIYNKTGCDNDTSLDLVDSHIARSLDMPRVPIFTTSA